MTERNLMHTWFCCSCNDDIFPFLKSLGNAPHEVSKPYFPKKICHCCSKSGSKLQYCELCGQESHLKCFVGSMGCRDCVRDMLPGFDADPRELLGTTTTNYNDRLFNPFDSNSDINNLGHTDDDQGDYENTAWDPCSNILKNCNYYNFTKIKASRGSELKVLSLNIRSISDKIQSLKDDSDNYAKFDILCFNETCCSIVRLPFGGTELKLDSFHPPIIQSPARSSSKGGGLIIYINNKLCSENDYKILSSLSENDNYENGEFLFLEINRSKARNIIVGNMYRSPKGNPTNFVDRLEHKLKLLKRHSKKLIVLTSDSNIDLLNFNNHDPTDRLVNTMAQYGMYPVISRPTRITSHSATLIDHIFINDVPAVTKSGIITIDISDHIAPFVNVLIDREKINIFEDSQTNRQMTDDNLCYFKNEIKTVDWNFITNIECANEKYNAFEVKYREIYEKSFPPKTKKKKKRNNDKPWLLPWLKGACDRKNILYNTFVQNRSIENETKYRKMKKFVAKHIKKAKNKYYKDYFQRYSDDSRKQWQKINELLNRKKSKVKISKLDNGNNETITKPQDIADRFNSFFCNVAQRLKDEAGRGKKQGRPPDPNHYLAGRCPTGMSDSDCTITEIELILDSLKNKATSDLAIQPLKHISKVIAPVLRHLVSASFEQGIFPDLLKCAKVIPLHKSGSHSDVGNYRPISLLSCFSKIYEKVMHKKLTTFLEQNKILFKSQYGFRALHSCEHALLEAQNHLNTALDKKQIAALLLIDFSKAFDMVDHNILLNKLEHYGIRGNFLSWFRSYLIGRKQYVNVNNTDSERLDLNYSVPQGSILGPVLFIIYINDLPNISSLANFVFFADDANIIVTGNDLSEIKRKIDNLLIALDTWVRSNGLKLNVKKTKFMVFSNKNLSNVDDLKFSLDGITIEQSVCERFLGVIMDSKLTWTKHISTLASKVSRNGGLIYKLKGIVPQSVLMTLYNSFIQSHLNYCSNVWGLGSKSSVEKIFIAQKRAVRAVENGFQNYFYNSETGDRPCHTKYIFNKYNILTIHNLIAKNCLVLMHKVHWGVTPTNISNLLILNEQSNRNSRHDLNFFNVPKSRLTALEKTLPFKGTRLYNYVLNELIKNDTCSTPDSLFVNPFKRLTSSFLINAQSTGNEDWDLKNFPLYGFFSYKT